MFSSQFMRFAAIVLILTALPFLAVHAGDEGEPLLCLEAGGPTSYVTALAFSPDEQTLYAGSWDKTVRVWRRDAESGEFQLAPDTWRVPIGPGLDGAINAITVSDDGQWLAVGGKAVVRGAADFRRPGRIVPTLGAMTDAMRQDEGTIYVFEIATRKTYTLRGHRGEVRALKFAPGRETAPVLVSAAREWNENTSEFIGTARVWNVLADKPYVQGLSLPEPRRDAWPKLAVRSTGPAPTAIEVAIAWGDGTFRAWDVAQNKKREAAKQGQFDDTVVFDATTNQFFSGAIAGDGTTHFRAWNPAAAELSLDTKRSLNLARQAEIIAAPRAMSFVSARPRAKADVLASVIHRHFIKEPASDQYELWLVGPAGIQSLRLWETGTPPRRVPTMATVPGGEFIAVSHGAEIQVHRIADVQAKVSRPQRLRSVGSPFAQIAFARRGAAADAERGLMLRESGANDDALDIFDLSKSSWALGDERIAWKLANGNPGTWKMRLVPPAAGAELGPKLELVQDGKVVATIQLQKGREVTSYAFAPQLKTPLLAVATHRDGLPDLAFYQATSGRKLRQLSAHTGLIKSLAFSDDGKFLASTGDDQFCCVWQTSDLNRIVNKRGMAPGVSVKKGDGGLNVTLDDTELAPPPLKTGDVVLGRVLDGELDPWPTAQGFYDSFWNAIPGTTIRVRRVRDGAAADIDVPVVQGIDERKPLFSLFATRPGANGKRGWIAWSPLGPYQSSDDEMEKYLGWHFNTGRPESPVGFAEAAEYHEQYYRRGLIPALLATGEPPAVEKNAAAPVEPQFDILLTTVDIDLGGDLLVREAPGKIDVVVAAQDQRRIKNVIVQFDGEPLAPGEALIDRRTWSSAIAPNRWTRGEHKLVAIATTVEGLEYRQQRRVRFQPLAPSLQLISPVLKSDAPLLLDPNVRVQATAQSRAAGEAIIVELRKTTNGKSEVVKSWREKDQVALDETIVLSEGGNEFELVARNANAMAGSETAETTRVRLALNYSRAALPELSAASLLTGEEGRPTTVDAALGPTVVTVDKVKLAGNLRGARGDWEVQSSAGAAAKMAVSRPDNNKTSAFVTGDLELKPGVQTIKLSRGDAQTPGVETSIQVEYRPPLPDFVVQTPAANLELDAAQEPPHIAIAASFATERKVEPFTAELLVNGEVVEAKPTIDLAARTLKVEAPLGFGGNAIELRVRNEWNEPRMVPVAKVRYLQLPTVEFAKLGEPTGSTIDVPLHGTSATPVTQVEVNQVVLKGDSIQYDAATSTWKAVLPQVQLQAEPYTITAEVWNRDGKSRVAAQLALPALAKADNPPLVTLEAGGNVIAAEYEARFQIRSKSPLKSIQILHDKRPVAYEGKFKELKPDAAGWYTLDDVVPLSLDSGLNRLEIRAASEGGSHTDAALVNYIDPPARMVIDRIETLDVVPKVLPVSSRGSSPRVEGPCPEAKVLLCGRLIWPKTTAAAHLNKPQRLQVWVNGFQQSPVDIEPVGKSDYESRFRAFVVLNKKERNRVQVSLPDTAADAAAMTEVFIDCTNPVVEQRLHVLVVGVGQPTGTEPQLESQTLQALQARRIGRDLRTAAFDRVAIYGPLVGTDITPQQIRHQLALIKVKIDELYAANRSSQRPANDAVMIYLEGGTLADAEGDFYITTRPSADPRTARALKNNDRRVFMDVALRSNTLADFLAFTTGAHVLFLDVQGTQNVDEAARWPRKSQAAMMRFTWLKDSLAPPNARLFTALPSALRSAGELRELDQQFNKFHDQMASEYPESINYRRWLPRTLQGLVIGDARPVEN